MENQEPKLLFYFYEKKSMLFFIVVMIVVTLFFSAFIRPTEFLRTEVRLSNWPNVAYIVLQCTTALITWLIIRYLIYLSINKKETPVFVLTIYICIEVLIILLLMSTVASLTNLGKNLLFVDLLWRVLVNGACIVFFPYVITSLIFIVIRQHQIIDENKMTQSFGATNMDSDEYINFRDAGGKLAFSIRKQNVLFLESADNYCNIHYINGEKIETFILHNSMKRVETSGLYSRLLRCHRRYMINIDNVKSLRKDKNALVLELNFETKPIPVSNKYNESIVRFFSGISNDQENANE